MTMTTTTADSKPIKCGKAHGYHATVDDVRRCYNGEDVDFVEVERTPDGQDRATRPQVRRVRERLLVVFSTNGHRITTAKPVEAYGRREISPLIDLLNKNDRISPEVMHNFGLVFDVAAEEAEDGESLAPSKPRDYVDPRATAERPFDSETLEDGFYVYNGIVYKVIRAVVQGSGRKYAKKLQTDGRWAFARGLVKHLRPEHKMTLRQALETAHLHATSVDSRLYGRCFVCGRTLTREDSIERMMGPVCAGKFGE